MFVQPRLIGKMCLWRHAKYYVASCTFHCTLKVQSPVSGANTTLNVELEMSTIIHTYFFVGTPEQFVLDVHLHNSRILGA